MFGKCDSGSPERVVYTDRAIALITPYNKQVECVCTPHALLCEQREGFILSNSPLADLPVVLSSAVVVTVWGEVVSEAAVVPSTVVESNKR